MTDTHVADDCGDVACGKTNDHNFVYLGKFPQNTLPVVTCRACLDKMIDLGELAKEQKERLRR